MVALSDFETKIGTTYLDYEEGGIYNSYHKYSHEKAVNKLLPESNGGIVVDLGCAGGTYYDVIKNKNYKTIYGLTFQQPDLKKPNKRIHNL